MAAAETRTAWQRMANRCFVQEDAKRAPKLACCPSSASKLQSDTINEDAANNKDRPVSNFAYLHWNPTNLNLPLETKWWLQVQPNFCYQEESFQMEHKTEDNTEVRIAPELKVNTIGNENNDNTLLDAPRVVSAKLYRHNSESKIEGTKTETSTPEFLKHKRNIDEHQYESDHPIGWKSGNQLMSGEKNNTCLDLTTPWASGEKMEPWWKIADREELASFVAKRSLEFFDNCDLPRPQKVHISRGTLPCFEDFKDDVCLSSSVGKSSYADICNQPKHALHSSVGSFDRGHMSISQVENLSIDSDMLLSCDPNTTSDVKEKKERILSSGDPSKDELLEALCHSQTRAREAEMAAQKAYDEKEHILKLFFRQASHLFAYKQWLRLLQLEKLYLQLKMKKEQDPSPHTSDLPWAAAEENTLWENCGQDEQKRGKGQHPCGICGFLFAFAVGFSLASAGLLLGWTWGCLLPV